jgi:hypothetical protein
MTRSICLLAPVLTAALGLAACTETSDGPDLTGVWRVTAHNANTTGCTAGPAVVDPAFIKFTQESIFGQKYFQYVGCSDAGTTCDASNGLFGLSYATSIPDGWQAELYVSSGDTAHCSLTATLSTAVVGADGSLAIETRQSLAADIAVSACTTEEAKARLKNGTLMCASFETISAVR